VARLTASSCGPSGCAGNLEASHYLFFSQRVLNALVEAGLGRDDAYRLVQRASMRAWEEELDFRELCRCRRRDRSRVDLDATFDLTSYTRHVDTSSPVSNR
jgi:adenylosuccinate lyase